MKENKIIIITMIINFIVAIIKLAEGITFSFTTLIADSVQSFIDFVTDITSLIANKIGKRRANKNYPFGYGQAYCLANLFTGILLFLIGIFILYQFFFFKGKFEPNINIFIVLIIVLILKSIVVFLLNHFGKNYKNELMIEAAKESRADVISTCVVLLILVLSVFEKYLPTFINIDKIGSLFMAVYVFYTSIKIIISNIRSLLTNTEVNDDMKKEIKEELNRFSKIDFQDISIIKMYTYYHVLLKIKVDSTLTMKEYLKMEKRIKKHIKNQDKEIRFIDIIPVGNI